MQHADAPLAGIAREGWPVVFLFALLAMLAWLEALWAVALAATLLTLLALGFFREPRRRPRGGPSDVHAPLSGRVMSVRALRSSPLSRPAQRIRLRVNPFGGYALRAPIDGQVAEIADGDGSLSWIRGGDGHDVVIRVPRGAMLGAQPLRVAYGQRVGHGRRVGPRRLALIMDVFLPDNARVVVRPGQRLRAGESIIASLRRR